MKISTVEKLISGVGFVAIAGAAYWLGSLETRVTQLEKQAIETATGPRGQSCQLIVGQLVKRPDDRRLLELSERFGCSGFAAAGEVIAEESPGPVNAD